MAEIKDKIISSPSALIDTNVLQDDGIILKIFRDEKWKSVIKLSHITTAEGVNVHYKFNTDGSVVKEKEIDLNAILAEFDGRIAELETN